MFSLFFLDFALVFVGIKLTESRPRVQQWALNSAVATFLLFCIYAVLRFEPATATEWLFLVFRGLLAGGLAMGLILLVLFVLSIPFGAYQGLLSRLQSRAERRRYEKRAKMEERRRRESQKEWERTAPERERQRLEEEAQQREERQSNGRLQRRKEDALAACELLYALYAPEISDRFSRSQFDDYASKFMSETHTAEVVEHRAKDLQQLILNHHDKANPPEKFHSLEELAKWYAQQKESIEGLAIQDSFKQDYLVQLNERYADLTQQVMENLTP